MMTTNTKAKSTAPTNVQFLTELHQLLGDKSTDVATQGGSGTSPKTGFDCSGLIYYVLVQLGFKNVPRDSASQWAWVMGRVSTPSGKLSASQIRNLKPGMLVFSNWPGDTENPGHVQVYIGKGKVLQSPGTASGKVQIVSLASDAGHIVGYGSIPGLRTATLPKGTTMFQYFKVQNWEAPKNYSDNAVALLMALNIFPTNGAIAALASQQAKEASTGKNNPFGLVINGKVANFATWQQGIAATAAAFRQPSFSHLRGALNEFSSPKGPTDPKAYAAWVCKVYGNALKATPYEGLNNSASGRAANASYGASVTDVCMSVKPPAPTGSYAKWLFNAQGGTYGANWWDPLEIHPTKTSEPVPFGLPNPLSAVDTFYHDIEHLIGFLTSAKTWWIVLGGILVLIGLFMLFRHQIGGAVHTAAEVAP